MSPRRAAPSTQHARAARAAAACALCLALGCLFWGFRTWRVNSVQVQGPYRALGIDNGSESLRLYFPADACSEQLPVGSEVRYVDFGTFGRVANDDQSCEAVGVGDLATWVRRKGRPIHDNVKPREEARFELLYDDEVVFAVRGQFTLAPLVFIPGGNDLVAFLPNTPACRRYVAEGSGPLNYSRSSRTVLWLGGTERCPLLGLALPLDPR